MHLDIQVTHNKYAFQSMVLIHLVLPPSGHGTPIGFMDRWDRAMRMPCSNPSSPRAREAPAVDVPPIRVTIRRSRCATTRPRLRNGWPGLCPKSSTRASSAGLYCSNTKVARPSSRMRVCLTSRSCSSSQVIQAVFPHNASNLTFHHRLHHAIQLPFCDANSGRRYVRDPRIVATLK